MEKAVGIFKITGVFIFFFSFGIISGNNDQSDDSNPARSNSKTVQAQTKPKQNSTKSNSETVRIGSQNWAKANLNVITFRNGDTIPEARTNIEWTRAGESGKPAWCYFNNDTVNGPKFGKLYNWYAVNDPRGLAPEGWSLPGEADWFQLAYFLGGPNVAGRKLKSTFGWIDGYNGDNESGFNGLPGGYRIENGIFKNPGSMGAWWTSADSKSASAIVFYLSQRPDLGTSSSPKQRGESVRCLKK